MLTKPTRKLSLKSVFFRPLFGLVFLSLFLTNFYNLFGQDEEKPTFDESIVSSGESLFKGNCTVCHAINEVVIGPALRDVHERQSEEWIYAFIKNSQKVIKSGVLLTTTYLGGLFFLTYFSYNKNAPIKPLALLVVILAIPNFFLYILYSSAISLVTLSPNSNISLELSLL